MSLLNDSALLAKAERCRERMRKIAAQVTWSKGWNIFDLPSREELITFFSSLTKPEIYKFDQDVFGYGHDPKTYMRIHRMKESTAVVELEQEIWDKETVYGSVPNCGGVRGHDGADASTSSGFRDGYHPSMDMHYCRRIYADETDAKTKKKSKKKAAKKKNTRR
ncbi:hypothetical protein L3Y34_006970 [Caenorhabditis briggsae]|uniref:Uncharacterized protein n=1 Tax=Caenorhabditis briggsae TaxID=6238 RepID=A0AAE9D081_CAEBR|nr:hypothetical protein L3Y34_006970 [Caenorhabditis briggsae]